MNCPNCGDRTTGVFMWALKASSITYNENEGESVADLCSYPELELEAVDAGTMAECMDCEHNAELRDFFPGDVNA